MADLSSEVLQLVTNIYSFIWLYTNTIITCNLPYSKRISITEDIEHLHNRFWVSCSVPTGFLVQEPNIASPQEAVEESNENAGISFTIARMFNGFTVCHIHIYKHSIFVLLTRIVLILKYPILHMSS